MKPDTNKSDNSGCAWFIVALLLAPFLSMWRGYVLAVLWSWFAVPVFGLPTLILPAAIGIALIVSYLTHQVDMRTDDRSGTEKALSIIYIQTAHPAIVLLIGWIVNHWM